MDKGKMLSNRYYKLLFIVICSIFIVILGILSYVASFFYTSKVNEENTHITKSYLEDIAQNFTTVTSEMDTLYSFLMSSNSVVMQYLVNSENLSSRISDVKNNIESVGSLNAHISSIVLYNYTNDTYLTSDSSLDMHQFLKAFMKDSLENLPAQAKQRAVFAYRTEAEQPTLLSMVYYTLNKNSGKYYCIVFNLNTESLGNSLFSSAQIAACMVNEYGTVINSHMNFYDGIHDIPFSWIKRAASETASGSFRDTYKGRKHTISYRKLEGTGWYCFAENADKSLILFIRQYFFLFLIGDILLALGITFFFVRKLYNPVNNTLLQLKQIVKDPEFKMVQSLDNSKNDEFTYMNSVVSALSGKLQDLKQENRDHLMMLRKAFLRSLMVEEFHADNINKMWELYGVSIEMQNIRLLLIGFEEDIPATSSVELPIYGILEMGVKKYFDPIYNYELVEISNSRYVILLNFDSNEAESELLEGNIKNLLDFTSIVSGMAVVFVLDDGVYKVDAIHTGYKSAVRLLKECFVLGYGRIITQNDVDTELSTLTTYPDDLIKEMIVCIKKRNRREFMSQYDNLVEYLSSYVYQDVIRVLIHLIAQMTDAMRSITVNNQYLNMDFSSIDDLFKSIHTLKETKKWFLQIFDKYLEALQESALDKNDVYWEAIKKAQKEIMENYSDANLSIESISEHVGYSSNYFSKMYKNLTGIYLKDYIKSIRISQATRLLTETNLTINEISGMTGFLNQNYFFAAFKKELGLTPAVYRKQHKKQRIEEISNI